MLEFLGNGLPALPAEVDGGEGYFGATEVAVVEGGDAVSEVVWVDVHGG